MGMSQLETPTADLLAHALERQFQAVQQSRFHGVGNFWCIDDRCRQVFPESSHCPMRHMHRLQSSRAGFLSEFLCNLPELPTVEVIMIDVVVQARRTDSLIEVLSSVVLRQADLHNILCCTRNYDARFIEPLHQINELLCAVSTFLMIVFRPDSFDHRVMLFLQNMICCNFSEINL